MDYMDFLKNILNFINNHSNLGLLIVAVLSFLYVRKEYFLKRRPFIDIEIASEIKKEEEWSFYIILINKGTFPGIAKITKSILKIGDEIYPTVFNQETVLSPEEKKKIFPIGHINKNGLEKIRNHKYRINRVEIIIESESKAIGDKKFLYKTNYEYEINVENEKPIIKIITELLK
jgi:hypothetical protein